MEGGPGPYFSVLGNQPPCGPGPGPRSKHCWVRPSGSQAQYRPPDSGSGSGSGGPRGWSRLLPIPWHWPHRTPVSWLLRGAWSQPAVTSPSPAPVAGGTQGRDGGVEPAVIVTSGEKESNPVYGKGASAATGQRPSCGDRGPLLEKQEERISRTHRATRRPAAPASAASQQLPPATSCLSVYPLVSVPLTTRPRLPALGVELPSVFSPAVGRGFVWRLLPPAPRPHRDQPLRCAHWAPSFRQRRGAQQAWPLWSPRPVWKPSRGSAPHRKPALSVALD